MSFGAVKIETHSLTNFKFIKSFLIILFFIIIPISSVLSQEYFQQEVNYEINVILNDRLHELNAFETVEYINNSPDTISFLFFHLWPNGYSNNQTALAKQLFSQSGKTKLFNDPELRGYIDSLNFKVDGNPVKWNLLPESKDICRIYLNEALCPGDTIIVTTPFHVKIPSGAISRLGHIGESYQISQWYPKPAVYDKSGWHQMPYLDQGEFYSEFGSFDVSITLPENYTVGATGTLQNDEEAERLDKLAADTAWKGTIDYRGTEFPPSSGLMKTLRYTGKEIHDFAWFADKRFHVLKSSVNLPESGREVITWVMFTNQQAYLWKDALKYVNRSILYFSNRIGDYPYSTFTAVQSALTAGSGMEYPGLTVIGIADDAYSLDEVIAHEICHNWFYSALGSDERRYPFMDESITSAYELRYMHEMYPGRELWKAYYNKKKMPDFFHIDKMPAERIQELEWLSQARMNLEQPINLPATDYSTLNYSLIIYDKAAIGFNYLRAWLGDSVFDSTMHNYYDTWRSKHPQPDDLRTVFESMTDKNLTWFFSDFLTTTKRLDYKVIRFRNKQLHVKNRGEMLSPLVIAGMQGDSICFEQWSDGFKRSKWIAIPPGDYSEIKIDPLHLMPELYRLNNNIRESGIFPKADPVRFQLLYTIDDPDKRTIIYIPTVNWTRENGIMAGLILHNELDLSKPVEYFVMPFYTFRDPDLAGYGRISFNIIPYDNLVRMATLKLEATQFGAPGNQNYHKMQAGLDLFFRNKKAYNPVLQKVYGMYTVASDLFKINLAEKADMSSYLKMGYILEDAGLVNPFKLSASYETGKSFQKLSLEINYKFSYYGKDQGLDIRMFAGTMLKYPSAAPLYSFSASGRSGRELYLYQGTYPDRFSIFPKTFWSRQMTLSEGGLVSAVNDSLGYSHWLISVSLSGNLPGKAGKMPVKPFINFLLNDHGSGTGHNSPFFYEVGLKAGIWNFIEFHIPLLVSPNIGSISSSIKERIRIVLNLDAFYKFKLNAIHKN